MGREMEGLRTISESPPNKEAPAAALGGRLTPTGSFFVRSHFPVPTVDVDSWRLRVEGEVGSPQEFTYRQLSRMPQSEVEATLECAGNGRDLFPAPAQGEIVWGVGAVGAARWSGVRLSKVLEAAKVRHEVTEVVAEGADRGKPSGLKGAIRFSRALPISKAMSPETLIALRMNGRRLAAEHGFPARLIAPGWYGMASVKWVRRIEVIRGAPYSAFFNGTKYVYAFKRDGAEVREPVTEVRVSSLITAPLDGARVRSGIPVVIRGKAWSGAGRVARVDVDLGGGWQEARLVRTPGRFTWRSWSLDWVPGKKGRVALSSRVTDEKGNVQPLEPFDNRLQYGCNAVRRVSVEVV